MPVKKTSKKSTPTSTAPVPTPELIPTVSLDTTTEPWTMTIPVGAPGSAFHLEKIAKVGTTFGGQPVKKIKAKKKPGPKISKTKRALAVEIRAYRVKHLRVPRGSIAGIVRHFHRHRFVNKSFVRRALHNMV